MRLTPPRLLLAATLLPGCDDPPDPTSPDPGGGTQQILFGDLHVHSAHSTDAALVSTPLLAGRGVGGPAMHCDFARFCAQLDFWAITDHPEGALPERWAQAQEDIRTCNQLEGGYDASPRMVSFVGWEWTQSAEDPSADWGG